MPTFQEALIRSFRQSGLFASVTESTPAQYELQTEFLKQEERADRVVLVIRYVLSDHQTGRQVLDQEIATTSATSEDATPGTSLVGGKSGLSRAAFRAAGNNIALLLAKLRSLDAP